MGVPWVVWGRKWGKLGSKIAAREPRQWCVQVKTDVKREYHNLLSGVCNLIEVAVVAGECRM